MSTNNDFNEIWEGVGVVGGKGTNTIREENLDRRQRRL